MLRATLWLAALAWIGSSQAQNIIRGEYFFDTDNGFGENTPLLINATSNVTDTTYTIAVPTVPGVHTLGIRTMDDSARWSHTNFTTVLVTAPPPPEPDIVEVRYFLNQDPGWDQGDLAWSGSDQDTAGVTFTADLSNATEGVNTLFVRSRTSDGRWSHTNHSTVLVTQEPTQGEIDRVESFWISGEVDPGFGEALATPVPDPSIDLIEFLFERSHLSEFQWGDTLAIRSHDTEGHWSHTNFVQVSGWTDIDALQAGSGISVFPNPFVEVLTVQPTESLPVRVVLYDPAGKKVYDQLLTGNTTIDLSGHASGAYTAIFWQELERIHRVTLIKQ